MIRTRYAPSPTGAMHIGNLRTALFEYLIAKSGGGKFILRIEDTDQKREVEGAVDVIYDTLKAAGIKHDEGPDVGGGYGPYIQSERKSGYLGYALQLVEKGKAYYCFCGEKSEIAGCRNDEPLDDAFAKYDRRCLELSKEEVDGKLARGAAHVIRQLIPAGKTTFKDEVYGEITFDNAELEDQILIKSDGMPTYNFANVIDDCLMDITHVVRGNEYITSTPKYNILYEALGWNVPKYVHLPLLLNESGEKMSKRRGDASFAEMIEKGYLPEAVVNYIAFLGWSPADNQEIFTLDELTQVFSAERISKAPSKYDEKKLEWFNGEHIKLLPAEKFWQLAEPFIKKAVKRADVDLQYLARLVQSRVTFAWQAEEMLDFIDALPEYDVALYTHKKMKSDAETSLNALRLVLPLFADVRADDWNNDFLYALMVKAAEGNGLKNSQVLWPVRTALSGKAATPCGASELAVLLGKEETLARVGRGLNLLSQI